MIASISTIIRFGREPMPTAERAWRPAVRNVIGYGKASKAVRGQ